MPELAEPISHYTDAVRAGDLLFVSGCVPVDGDGQARAAATSSRRRGRCSRTSARCSPRPARASRDVVKVTVFLIDVDDRRRSTVRQEVFGDARPASTLVEVSALAIPGALIEVEAVALVP